MALGPGVIQGIARFRVSTRARSRDEGSSRPLYALRVHANAVQGRGRDNKHLIVVRAPKCQVRHNFRYMNERKPGAVGMKDLDSDRAATEDPASAVQPKPVGQSLTLSNSGEDSRIDERSTVYYIEHTDVVKTLVAVGNLRRIRHVKQ